jgi:hypothetical protein
MTPEKTKYKNPFIGQSSQVARELLAEIKSYAAFMRGREERSVSDDTIDFLLSLIDSDYIEKGKVERALMCSVGESEEFIAGIRHVANALGYFEERQEWMAIGIDLSEKGEEKK